jgi:hypothetical protein
VLTLLWQFVVSHAEQVTSAGVGFAHSGTALGALPPSLAVPEQALVHFDVWQLWSVVSAPVHPLESPAAHVSMQLVSLHAHVGRHA